MGTQRKMLPDSYRWERNSLQMSVLLKGIREAGTGIVHCPQCGKRWLVIKAEINTGQSYSGADVIEIIDKHIGEMKE